MILQLSPESAGCQVSGGGCSSASAPGHAAGRGSRDSWWLFKGWGSGSPWAGGIPFSRGAECERVLLLHNGVK